MPKVLEAAKAAVKDVPLTKREARERHSIDPRTGKRYVMTFPADMWRQYDEALVNVIHMRKQEGYHIPKRQSTIAGTDSCMPTSTVGTMLGFAYGL